MTIRKSILLGLLLLPSCIGYSGVDQSVFATASALSTFVPTSTNTLLPPTIVPTETPASTPTPVPSTPRPAGLTKFEPPDGQVLVFIGPDNASVGGTSSYNNGYVDHIGIPAGVTTYAYMIEGGTSKFGYNFDTGHIDGLLTEANWGSGPVCAECYLASRQFSNSIIHVSISMEASSEYLVADGTYDYLIDELADFLQTHSDHPFFLRIGYEFDNSASNYDPGKFKLAFCRIVDRLHAQGIDNFATVYAASSVSVGAFFWDAYYPGDEYVDWIGYSYWDAAPVYKGGLDFARGHGKPVIIAESAPLLASFPTDDGAKIWERWFIPYFMHVLDNSDVIKAISYMSFNWPSHVMWKRSDWKDTRIEANDVIREKWISVIENPIFINGNDDVFGLIGFIP
ncbi:MAG: glycoside hydrolase family 26 protein [Anaerolineales bacterium]|nr:glycoside hydrolase family 26 protein [Anaerolineales bacterium]